MGVQFLLYGILYLLLAVFDLIDDFVTRVLPRIGSQQQGYDRTDEIGRASCRERV